jgi:repressor of nif and glnA expression
MAMSEKTEKKRLAILRILQKADKPIGSTKIVENLQAMGHDISERTVRHYLLGMDKKGLTENLGKKGRQITGLGLKELDAARVIDKVGFLSAKIDQITYRMNFDLYKRTGTVVVNISVISLDQVKLCLPLISRVYRAGYSMGDLIGLFKEGEKVGDIVIPENTVGIGTVCSITLNGVLLAHGIPTKSRFGGLLELQNKKPVRFVEIITYEGTSLDPLEVFIRSGMTDYLGATATGNGRIGVGFREIPMDSRDNVIELAQKLEGAGLGGFLSIGWPSQPLLEIPVSTGSVGVIVIGGLNPAAILEESDIKIKSRALAGLVEYERLFPYMKLDECIKKIM